MFRSPVQSGVYFVSGTTNMDPQGSGTGWSPCLSKPWSLEAQTVHWCPFHSTVFPRVLSPNVHFQFSLVHPFQTEKCAQSWVSTLKIWIHSCSCFKLPTGSWIDCFISASVLHLKGKLAYSHQHISSFLRGRMCLCALHSKSLIWAAACSYHCITKSRWKRKWPSH